MDINSATGKAISAERAIAGMTVRDLSQKAGIPLSSLMRVLQAEREIKINQIAAIAAALDLYPHDIVEHAERIMERENRTAPVVKLPAPTDQTRRLRSVSEPEPMVVDESKLRAAKRSGDGRKQQHEGHVEEP